MRAVLAVQLRGGEDRLSPGNICVLNTEGRESAVNVLSLLSCQL